MLTPKSIWPCRKDAPVPEPNASATVVSLVLSPPVLEDVQPLVFSAHRLLSLEPPPPQAERNRAAVIGISIFDKCM